jgi:hypothetical protein
MSKEYEQALKMIVDAIANKDLTPKQYKMMDDKLRSGWPELWRAVHYAADVYEENND